MMVWLDGFPSCFDMAGFKCISRLFFAFSSRRLSCIFGGVSYRLIAHSPFEVGKNNSLFGVREFQWPTEADGCIIVAWNCFMGCGRVVHELSPVLTEYLRMSFCIIPVDAFLM